MAFWETSLVYRIEPIAQLSTAADILEAAVRLLKHPEDIA
jgi:hypothetical protein